MLMEASVASPDQPAISWTRNELELHTKAGFLPGLLAFKLQSRSWHFEILLADCDGHMGLEPYADTLMFEIYTAKIAMS
jgi:hypothetical protein